MREPHFGPVDQAIARALQDGQQRGEIRVEDEFVQLGLKAPAAQLAVLTFCGGPGGPAELTTSASMVKRASGQRSIRLGEVEGELLLGLGSKMADAEVNRDNGMRRKIGEEEEE